MKDAQNLAAWLVRARGGRTQHEAADAGQASVDAVSAWERGVNLKRPGRVLRRYCELALGWTPDSVDRVLAGGEPELAGQLLAVRRDMMSATGEELLERIRTAPLSRREREVLARELMGLPRDAPLPKSGGVE